MIGIRIREVRKNKKMTLEEFGKCIGLKKNSLSQIENGKNSVTDQNLLAICREFNVSESWLRTGEGEMFLKTPSTLIEQLKQKYSMDDFETNIIEEYLDLPAEKRAVFKEFIYKLASKAQVAEENLDSESTLLAAHARTDKKSTPEGQKHDQDIMMNDEEW